MDGGTVFLLTEDHLRELGFHLVGDRLYFVEVCDSYVIRVIVCE